MLRSPRWGAGWSHVVAEDSSTQVCVCVCVRVQRMAYSRTHMRATARQRVATQACILSMVSEKQPVLQQRQSHSKPAKLVCNHVMCHRRAPPMRQTRCTTNYAVETERSTETKWREHDIHKRRQVRREWRTHYAPTRMPTIGRQEVPRRNSGK